MNTIQAVMLVALGFIAANLIVVLLVPAYRRRCERLAEQRVRAILPATEEEIRADRDRLRAEFAVKIHQLSARVEDARLGAARQTIEINRRDAKVTELQASVNDLTGRLEEMTNARTVLEATVQDRLPKVEQRLAEAKKLIFQRDREIAALTVDAGKQARAFEEAAQINAEIKSEVQRLERALGASAEASAARSPVEVSLGTELEAMRAKAREQAGLIARLQASAGAAGAAPAKDAEAAADQSLEVARLKGELAEATAQLTSQRTSAETAEARAHQLEGQLRTLKGRLEDHAGEIARLKAALAVFEVGERDESGASISESKVALKARVSALEAQVASQSGLVDTLRGEVANANERVAQQGATYLDEMRKIGSGKQPSPPRRAALSERLGSQPAPAEAPKAAETAKASGFLKAVTSEAKSEAAAEPGSAAPAGGPAAEDVAKKPRLVDRIAGLAKS